MAWPCEAFTESVGGYPFLYADTFMTRDEFGRMFDLTLYERVRERYGCAGALRLSGSIAVSG